MNDKIIVRFAPSPTGFLHVGGLRTALFNYLFAKSQGGNFILRIEDTDRERIVENASENLIHSLQTTGLDYDEGPHKNGTNTPYFQSERLENYNKYANELLDSNKAYRCFCSTDELDKMRSEQKLRKLQTRYNGTCRKLRPDVIKQYLIEKRPYVIRMKIDYTRLEVKFNDIIRGAVSFKSSQLEDQVIMKSDGYPTYHLANVVDDKLMGVTHVIRGEEWLPSTPKHVLLYEHLGWKPPKLAHLPLLLNPDKSKLSKRQGDVATEDFLRKGYLPEALINFIALLGWNNGDEREIYSMQELIETFTLERVGKSGAVFDVQKLDWMNKHYIAQLSIESLAEKIKPYLTERHKDLPNNRLIQALEIVRGGLTTLAGVNEKLDVIVQSSVEDLNTDLLQIVTSEKSKEVFKSYLDVASQDNEAWSDETFMSIMKKTQKSSGIKGKELWIPIRIALTGDKDGPELPAVANYLGKDKCSDKISKYIHIND